MTALLCDNGPGMQSAGGQLRHALSEDAAWRRENESDDSDFFAMADFDPFWDQYANQVVAQLYDQLIPADAQILDLMAGAHSPLQQTGKRYASVECAGLNTTELKFNPICTGRRGLNVNTDLPLPYPDKHFDVILIHAAVEYATQPFILAKEVARLLTPGGRIIVTFSNRYVSEKAVAVWIGLEEFERIALVREYLHRNQDFSGFNAFSMRGLPRPVTDRHYPLLQYSDPVYALWADKR